MQGAARPSGLGDDHDEAAPTASQDKIRSLLLEYIAQKRAYDALPPDEQHPEEEDDPPVDADTGEVDLAVALFPPKDRLATPVHEATPLERLRTLASEAAKASRVAIRAGEDKVQQAVAMYDSVRGALPRAARRPSLAQVDRHIRRLDADLAKYEDSLVIGLRAGTLPSTEAPSLLRADATTSVGVLRPSAAITAAAAAGEDRDSWRSVVRVRGELQPSTQAPRQSSLPARAATHDVTRATSAPPPGSRKRKVAGAGRSRKVAEDDSDEVNVDPDEDRWCYCHRVAFGEVRLRRAVEHPELRHIADDRVR
jgi:hypothetical protein